MAFDVLVNLLTNADKLKQDINELKELSADLADQQREHARSVENQQSQIDDKRRDKIKELKALRETITEDTGKQTAQEAKLAKRREDVAKLTLSTEKDIEAARRGENAQVESLVSAERKLVEATQADVTKHKEKLKLLQQELDTENDTLVKIQKGSVARTRELQDQQTANRRQQIQRRSRAQQVVSGQRQLGGLGFALQQSGLPGLSQAGQAIISGAFAGPAAAAWTVVGQAVSGVVSLVKTLGVGIVDLTTSTARFYDELQASKNAVAGIIAQTSVLIDQQGNLVSEQQKFTEGLKIADELQLDLLQRVIKTNVTVSEANQAVQSSLGYLTQRGVDPKKAQDIIITLTGLAKTLSFTGAQAAREVRSVFTGTSSALTRFVAQSGLSASQIQANTGKSLEALFENNLDQFRKIIDESAKLTTVQVENVSDFFKVIFARAFGDAQSEIAKTLAQVLGAFQGTGSQFTGVAAEIQSSAKRLFDELARVTKDILTPENVDAFGKSLASILDISALLVKYFGELAAYVLQISRTKFVDFLEGTKNVVDYITHSKSEANLSKNYPMKGNAKTFSGESNIAGLRSETFRAGKFLGLTDEQIGEAVATLGDKINDSIDKYRAAHPLRTLFPFEQVLPAEEANRIKDEMRSVLASISTSKITPPKPTPAPSATTVSANVEVFTQQQLQDVNQIGRVQKAIAALGRQIQGLSKDERDLKKASDEALAAGDPAKSQQLKKQLQDLQISRGEKTRFIIPGIEPGNDEAARDKLKSVEESLKRKIEAENKRKADIATAKDAVITEQERTKELIEQQKETERLIDLQAQQVDNEGTLGKVTLQRLANQQSAADRAIKSAEKARTKANDAVIEAEAYHVSEEDLIKKRQRAAEAETAYQSALARSAEVRLTTQTQILSIVDQELDKQKQLTLTLKEAESKAAARVVATQGVSGPALTIAQAQGDRDTEAKDYGKANKEITDRIALLTKLRTLPTPGIAERTEGLTAGIEQGKEQLAIISKIEAHNKKAYENTVKKANAELVILEADSRIADVENQIELINQKQDQHRITAVDAFLQLRDLNEQLVDREQERLWALETQRDLVNENITNNEEQLGLVDAQSDAAKNLRVTNQALLLLQKQYTREIEKSQGKVDKLENEFTNVYEIIQNSATELAKFFDAIDLPKVAQFVKGLQGLGAGFKEIFGGPGGLSGFKDSISKTFSSVSEGAGGGAFGKIAGSFASVAKVAGPIGQAVSGFLQVFGSISALFKKAAAKMAKDIGESVSAISDSLSNGTTTLSGAISDLNVQLQRTYELERKKGGSEEAIKLRKQINQELADLKKQQKEILEGFRFDIVLQKLGEGYKDFATTLKEAQNKIKEFLGAGGGVAEAQTYLNNIIEKFREDIIGGLAQEQMAALQRAQELLDLQKQLNELDVQHAEAVRGILSQGLATRSLTFGQQKSKQLAEENKNYKDQQKQLNDQLDIATQLANLDKEILGTSIDLTDAEAIRLAINAGTVAQRQKELEVLRQQKELVDGLTKTDAGNFIISDDLYKKLNTAGLFAGAGTNVGVVNINLTVNGQLLGPQPVPAYIGNYTVNQLLNVMITGNSQKGLSNPSLQP